MSKEKSSPFGIIIIGVLAFIISGCAIGKSAGENKQTNTKKPEKPAEPEEPAFIKESLVAFYPFNGNAKDESGNGNDGEVKGATLVADRHGEEGKAYSFDGKKDFIEVSDADALDLGNGAGKEWAVTIWVNSNIKLEGTLIGKAGRRGSSGTDYRVFYSTTHRGFV